MARLSFSERELRDLQPVTERTDFWDEKLGGFGLRVRPSGRKSWVVRWRDEGGKWRFEGGGTWPVVKVEEAREWARKALSRASLGLPTAREERTAQEAVQAPTAGPTIRQLWAEYEARAKPGEKRNRECIGRLHVLPVLGDMPVPGLKSGQVDAIVRSLAEKPRTGNAVKVHIHGAYELARILNMFPDDRINPAHLVKGYGYKPRKRFLSDEEFAKVGAALADIRSNRVFELLHAELITLLLLTGARVGEWVKAEWMMLDGQHPALVLHEHKTDEKGEVKRIEMGPEAQRLVRELPRRSDMVFYGRAAQGRITEATRPWAVVRERAGIAHATIHDLRRSFSSACLNDGMSISDIGILLGHSELSTTGIYAIADIKRRQELIARAEKSVMRRLYPHA